MEAGQGHAGITFCKNYLTISIKELEKLLEMAKRYKAKSLNSKSKF